MHFCVFQSIIHTLSPSPPTPIPSPPSFPHNHHHPHHHPTWVCIRTGVLVVIVTSLSRSPMLTCEVDCSYVCVLLPNTLIGALWTDSLEVQHSLSFSGDVEREGEERKTLVAIAKLSQRLWERESSEEFCWQSQNQHLVWWDTWCAGFSSSLALISFGSLLT